MPAENVERLTIVFVILMIAAILLPALLRIKANEDVAIETVRTIITSAAIYASQYGHLPPTLQGLGPPAPNSAPSQTRANLIDKQLADPPHQKAGYSFRYALPPSGSYSLNADPITPGASGQRYFFTDKSGVIRVNQRGQGAAGPTSPPLDLGREHHESQ